MSEGRAIGAEQARVATDTAARGDWWSRFGDGLVTPALFWPPDLADATPRSEHIPFLFWLVDRLGPSMAVEVGEAPAVSYLACCQAVARLRLPSRCYAICGSETKPDDFLRHHARYAPFSQLLPADEAAERFEDGSVDLLAIDALERGALAREHRAWLRKLSRRAIVLVYGIDDPAIDAESLALWQVLTERHPHFEFLHGAGLGVLGVGEEPPPALRQLLALDPSSPRALEVREMFARLGAAVAAQAALADVRRRLNAALDSDQVAKLEAALAAAKDALAAARVDHVKTLKRLRKVEESLWWRITKPLRRLAKNHRWAIYNLHQWSMCAWWVATLRFKRMKKQMRPYRHARLVLKSGLLHEAWYLRQYPDVAAVGIPPALHYVLYGGFEGRDPSPMFSSQAYLDAYPDVRTAKTNPLVHYMQKGRYENRAISPSKAKPRATGAKR